MKGIGALIGEILGITAGVAACCTGVGLAAGASLIATGLTVGGATGGIGDAVHQDTMDKHAADAKAEAEQRAGISLSAPQANA